MFASSTTASRPRSTTPTRPPATGTSASRAAAQRSWSTNAGLIDEFSIALSPVLFGSGIRLFEGVDAGRAALEPVRAEHSPRVTHLTYAVRER